MPIFIPTHNVALYSFFVQLLYIRPLIIASGLLGTWLYLSVKHKRNKSRNKKLSVWRRNYLLKTYNIDKTKVLQNRGRKFVIALVRFTQKWWTEKHKNFDELCQSITNETELQTALKQTYYTQKEIETNQEKRLKEVIEKKDLNDPERM